MPRDFLEEGLNIAIIGTGISGLGAAWLLNPYHRVTVYEQSERVGGHCHTVDMPGRERTTPVDTGFIVYNETNYPNLTELFRILDVPTIASDMTFSVSCDAGRLEYCCTGLAGWFAQSRNLVSARHWRMIGDILRFYRTGGELLNQPDAQQVTLGDYLADNNYSDAFIDDHLLPMAAAIWSTPVGDMRGHPALAFIQFSIAHGLMRIAKRPRWRTVAGGSQQYVKRLIAPFAHRIRTSCGVRRIQRHASGVLVEDTSGRCQQYDRVIIAAHADQALRMLSDPSRDEKNLLGAFRYTSNRTLLHSDERLMPKRRSVWSSWNYMANRNKTGSRSVCVSYWMNRLQSIDNDRPAFVTLNPFFEPAPQTIIKEMTYEHPSYDVATLAAQRDLHRLQGQRHTWFCGSYCGAGFHEDALVSGLEAAEAAGGLRRPWSHATRNDMALHERLKWAAQ